jgi:outer membrane protein TolC
VVFIGGALVLGLPPVFAAGSLPPSARALLETLPGRTVSLPFVLEKAIESSDSFRALRAEWVSTEAPFLESQAMTDTALEAGVQREWNRNQPTSPFGSTRSDTLGVSVGLTKAFATGTRGSLVLTEGFFEGSFGAFGTFQSQSGQLRLDVMQNLWSDAFGRGTRKAQWAGEQQRLGAQAEWVARAEEWMIGLVRLFDQAELMQARVRAARAAVERRERVREITRLKERRGTAEAPDRIQVQGALTAGRSELAEARQGLETLWRQLVLSLKLPAEFLRVDPTEVPLTTDDAEERASKLCGSEFEQSTPREGATAREESLTALKEAAKASLEQVSEGLRPQLQLRGAVASNGVVFGSAREFSQRWTDIAALRNPAWTVGLQLQVPLEKSAQRAQALRAFSLSEALEARAALASSERQVSWLNACSELARWRRTAREFSETHEQQLERVSAEETRFLQGRVPAFSLLQAGDEAQQFELGARQARMQAHGAAWEVLRLSGSVKENWKARLTGLQGGRS